MRMISKMMNLDTPSLSCTTGASMCPGNMWLTVSNYDDDDDDDSCDHEENYNGEASLISMIIMIMRNMPMFRF